MYLQTVVDVKLLGGVNAGSSKCIIFQILKKWLLKGKTLPVQHFI